MTVLIIGGTEQDVPANVRQAVSQRSAGTYFPQKIVPPARLLWIPIWTVTGVVVSLAFAGLIFPIFIAIGILIWGVIAARRQRRHNRNARVALAEDPFRRGLYVGDDYLLFYLSPTSVYLLPRSVISDVDYISTFATNSDADDEIESRSKHHHFAFYMQHNGEAHMVVWRDFENGLKDPNGAVKATVNRLTQDWRIPYHRVPNRADIQTPPTYTAHHIQFTKVS